MANTRLSEALTEMEKLYLKYVTFVDKGHAFVCALWCAHTWLFRPDDMHGLRSTGYLTFVSPSQNCGKSSALGVTSALSYGNPSLDVIMTQATIFRPVEESKRQTMIFDELDAMRDDPMIIGVLNAGYTIGGTVPRMIGRDKDKLHRFPIFCPKALGYIRNPSSILTLKPTLESRCIRILLNKRTIAEEKQSSKFLPYVVKKEAYELVAFLREWELGLKAGEVESILGDGTPENPSKVDLPDLDGRETQVWESLLAVAWMAGRFEEAALVARKVVWQNREDMTDHGTDTHFLADLYFNLNLVCDEWGADVERIVELFGQPQFADRPYAERIRNKNKRVTTQRIAKLMAVYQLRTEQLGPQRLRRYHPQQLERVFEQYLPRKDARLMERLRE